MKRLDCSMPVNPLLETILDRLEQGECLAQATVVAAEGFTPRPPGSRMVLTMDGAVRGSLGCAGAEERVLDEARTLLPRGSAKLLEYDLDTLREGKGDTNCRGRMLILLEVLRATPQIMRTHRELAEHAPGKRFCISIYIGKPGNMARAAAHLISGYDQAMDLLLRSGFPEARQWLKKVMRRVERNQRPEMILLEGRTPWRFLIEALTITRTIYIAGGNEVGMQTARLAANNEFNVVILDERPERADPALHPGCDSRLVPDLGAALGELPLTKNSLVLITTRDRRHCQKLLEDAVLSQAGYIGMVCSHAGCDDALKKLARRGIKAERLKDVHCPVGLDIGAKTPSEIAVSVVAEIIKERGKKRA